MRLMPMCQMRYGGSWSVKEALCIACAGNRRKQLCAWGEEGGGGLFRDPGDDKARIKSYWAVG